MTIIMFAAAYIDSAKFEIIPETASWDKGHHINQNYRRSIVHANECKD